MVLVCGDPSEAVTAFFSSRLKSLKIDHRVLDLRQFTKGSSLDWGWRDGRPAGSLSHADWQVELTGIYYRNVSLDESIGEGDRSEGSLCAYPSTDPQLAGLLNSLPGKVVNRPAATYSNRSKPYQALVIDILGR